jgi:protein TonB
LVSIALHGGLFACISACANDDSRGLHQRVAPEKIIKVSMVRASAPASLSTAAPSAPPALQAAPTGAVAKVRTTPRVSPLVKPALSALALSAETSPPATTDQALPKAADAQQPNSANGQTTAPAPVAAPATDYATATLPAGVMRLAHPDYAYNPQPEYPELLREQGVGGVVWLKVWVHSDGQPGQVSLLRGSGYRLLDAAAVRAVHGWRFLPAKQGAQALASWVEFPIRFQAPQQEG